MPPRSATGKVSREPHGATTPASAGSPGQGAADRSPGPGSRGGETRAVTAPGTGWRAVAPLVGVVAVAVAVAVLLGAGDLVVVIAALVGIVMIHELGHFATAKWSGMKVTEYFLGFGPRLWSVRRGETEYGIKAIPAGGYVKIVGMSNLEEVPPEDEPRTYRQQPFRARLLVAAAGSFMHLVMALVLLWSLLVFVGTPDPHSVVIRGFAPLPDQVDPARDAGLRVGDQVLRADGRTLTGPADLSAVIARHAGQPLELLVERDKTELAVPVTPRVDPADGKARIGVTIGNGPDVPVGPVRAVGTTFVDLWRITATSMSSLPTALANEYTLLVHGTAPAGAPRIQSIVGAVRTTDQAAQAGAGDLLFMLVLINIFIGIFNMLPMLPLDGGHVAIALYERLRSRRGRRYHADVTRLAPYAYAFVALLAFVFVSSLFLDITHPVANQFR